jgi:Na+-driven multidrug efflux pump
MSKKRNKRINSTNKSTYSKNGNQQETSWFKKIRPFMFPLLFGLGATGAYFINTNNLMSNVGSSANAGIQITWVVQVCTYLCIIGLIVLGYQFESKLEQSEKKRA